MILVALEVLEGLLTFLGRLRGFPGWGRRTANQLNLLMSLPITGA